MGIIKEIKESLTSFARNHPLLLLYLILFVIISLGAALDYGYSAAAKILVYGILCEIFALVGFIPIAGPFIYCFLVDSYLNPLVPGTWYISICYVYAWTSGFSDTHTNCVDSAAGLEMVS